MGIRQDLIPAGRPNRPALPNPCEYITIHETGNYVRGSNASAHARYLRTVDNKISWHYTVDDKYIYQHLPEEETAFHAGDGAGDGNRKSIGIEICVNPDGDRKKAIELTARLVADIIRRRNIPIANIVPHKHWSGKNCPEGILKGYPVDWDGFLYEVGRQIALTSHWAREHLDSLISKGVIETPEAWLDFDSPATKGQMLALADKISRL